MALRHLLLLRWADHAGPDDVEAVRSAFDALAAEVPAVRRLTQGSGLSLGDGGADHVVVVDVDDVDAWRALRDHPSTVLLEAELLDALTAQRWTAQFVAPADDAAPPPGAVDETDDELMERARRAAAANMAAIYAEPDPHELHDGRHRPPRR